MRPIKTHVVRGLALMFAVTLALLGADSGRAAKRVNKREIVARSTDRMSSAGRLAARARAAVGKSGIRSFTRAPLSDEEHDCINGPECESEEGEEGPAGGQAEVSIAVDETGQHIVLGYNDFRGFALNPLSVSGVMYSDDGGLTFVDGGQLPSPGTDVIGTTKLPQVFGDPDVKYLGSCTFIYSSIMIKKFSATTAAQTMSVHRSSDCGHTWVGPFEVTAATNPNGLLVGGEPADAADKELMDVDPDTGRVILSWSNFTPAAIGGVEISVTYSDDIKTATPPTWSTRAVVGNGEPDGQGSVPRFAGNGANDVYVAWSRFPFPGNFGGLGNGIGFAHSTDNGVTWSPAVDLTPEFFTMDQVLGNDRVNSNPSMAVDNSGGRYRGNVYVVYSNDNSLDGADVVVQRSTDGGVTFSPGVQINSRPGADRAQWFPYVTVDTQTGRVYIFYYDQGIAKSGDLTETTYVFSDDAGRHWSKPLPISTRPFHAGWGNDTAQPNLGDYSQAVAQHGELFAAYAEATRPPLGFVDGQPSGSLTVPDVVFKRISRCDWDTNSLALSLGAVSFSDSGGNGNVDPKDILKVKVGLNNYVTNPISASSVNGVAAFLRTSTPGVSIPVPWSVYPRIKPGESQVNLFPYLVKVSNSFVPGTPIELELDVWGPRFRVAVLHHTLFTGTPQATTLFAENFDGVAPGTLPVGWVAAHGAGANTVRWTTSNTFVPSASSPCNLSNGAFHRNAEDGPALFAGTRWERLISPTVVVPADAEYVTLDFDVCYDTEDFPPFNVFAFDGFFLRITDVTPGHLLRSVLAEAFADEFTTGLFQHYPKHFPRSGNPAYFEDMSAWSGDSVGVKHVRMRLPGMQGTSAQLRFEYTQDSVGTCADLRPGHTCGVVVDNIEMKSVKSVAP